MSSIAAPLRFVLIAATLVMSAMLSRDMVAYTASGVSWSRTPVNYRINAANLDLPESAVEAAVRAGADTWGQQSRAAFSFNYAGPSTQTTNTNDGVNLVMFRNASNGSAIATTYWWSNSTGIIDADIVFWDASYRFFTGTSGCTGGHYIEDIAAHEFGHALGLGHSAVSAATMYPSTPSCTPRNRTLEPDDIAGVEALYPPLVPASPTGVRLVGGGE